MGEEEKKTVSSKWFNIIVTTIISIIITVSVAWYQISRSEEQEALASLEKEKNIRQELVSIVEEHIINSKPIDITRLSRLIELRKREEHISQAISVFEIIEKAEFNILNSKYLDFLKKNIYKTIFDSLYLNLSSGDFTPFTDSHYNDQMNQLAKSIQEGKTKEALENLRHLSTAVNNDFGKIKEAESNQLLITAFFKKISSEPFFILIFFIVYVVILYITYPRFRGILRRKLHRIKRE